MSWSEILSLMNCRRFAILLAALPAGGCFQPLYGEAAHPGLTADMRAIVVTPIKDRIGHYLGNDLIADLNGTGAVIEPKYRLTVTTTVGSQTPTVSSQIQAANAATVSANANYTLTSYEGADTVVTGEVTAVAVYDRTEERFANLRAERDSEIKLAKSLADEIELRLAARLTVHAGPIHGKGRKCIDIPEGVTTDGTKLNYWGCDGSDEQQWEMKEGALIGKDGKCLNISGGGGPDDAVLDIRACDGSAQQKWTSTGGVIAGKGNMCVDLIDGKTDDGTPVSVRKCNGGADQKWSF
jgi:LPS-assembly lipoprotein